MSLGPTINSGFNFDISSSSSSSRDDDIEDFDGIFTILASCVLGHGETLKNTPLTVASNKKQYKNSSVNENIFDIIQQYKDRHCYYFQPAGYDGCTIFNNVPGSKNSREDKYQAIVDSTFENLERANLCETSTSVRDYYTGAYKYFNAVAEDTKERWGNTNKKDQEDDLRETIIKNMNIISSSTGKQTSNKTKDIVVDAISKSSGANIIKPLKDELLMTFSGKANEVIRQGISEFTELSKKILGNSTKTKFDTQDQIDIIKHTYKAKPNLDQKSLAEMYRKYGNDNLSGFFVFFGAFCRPNGDTIMVKSEDGFAINESRNWFEIPQRFKMCRVLGEPGSPERSRSLSTMKDLPDRNWDIDNVKLDKMIREIFKKIEENARFIYAWKPMKKDLYGYIVPEVINTTEYAKNPDERFSAHKINTTDLSAIIITKMTTTVSTMLNLLLIIFLKHCVFEKEFDISRYFETKDGVEDAKLDFLTLLCEDGENSRQFSTLDICSTHYDVSTSRLPDNDLRDAQIYFGTNLRGDANFEVSGTMEQDDITMEKIEDVKKYSKIGVDEVSVHLPIPNIGPMLPENSGSSLDSQEPQSRGPSEVKVPYAELYKQGEERVAKEIKEIVERKSKLKEIEKSKSNIGIPRTISEVEDPFGEAIRRKNKIGRAGNSKGGRCTARCNKKKSKRVNNAKKYTKTQRKGKKLTIRRRTKSANRPIKAF